MKGLSVNKNKFHLGIRNYDTLINEIKVSEMKLNYNPHLLPIIDRYREKRLSVNSPSPNNVITNSELKTGKKLFNEYKIRQAV